MCNHENYDMIGNDYYFDEEQNTVEVTKLMCFDCLSVGYQKVIRIAKIEWDDPLQTKLNIQE